MDKELSTKQKAARFVVIRREQQTRYYISFKCKYSYIYNYKGNGAPYVRYVWPILFVSRELAEKAISVLPVFKNSEATNQRGRIVSVCVEKTHVRN